MRRLCTFLSLLFLSVASMAQWQLMNAPVTCFAKKPGTSGLVFAGDGYGLIRSSSDKGVTWKEVQRVGAGINDIAFADENKGFIATDQPGLLLITTDGGVTWHRKWIKDPNYPNDPLRFKVAKRVIVADPSTVFFDIYNHQISNPSSPETIVTRDGGLTFNIAYAPGNLYHVAGDTLVAFGRQKDQSGFLDYFAVFRSLDKGQSWETFQYRPTGLGTALNGNGINFAFFFTFKEYYLTANKTLGSDASLYKTVDGGRTFTTVPKPGQSNAKVEWLHFKDRQNGVAMSLNGSTFYTSNGGTSWTQAAKGGGHYPSLSLDNQTIITDWYGITYTSEDGGVNWNPHSDVVNSANGAGSFFFLQTVNEDVSYASIGALRSGVYEGYNLVKTNDRGITWHNVRNASNTVLTGETFAVLGVDTFLTMQSSGFNSKRVVKTVDGGKTFSTKADNLSFGILDATPLFKFIDKRNLVAYGRTGFAYFWLSTDTGSTWTKLPQFTPAEVPSGLVDISFPSLNSWYILVDNGTKVYKSTNQGTSWANVTNGILFSCPSGGSGGQGLHFVNDSTGYVYGCGGNLFKTTDGAKTWSNLRSTLSTTLQYNLFGDMRFQRPDAGYLLSAASEYPIMTTDGNDWNSPAGLPGGVKRVDFPTENTGSALVSSGYFYRYVGPTTWVTDTVTAGVIVSGLENAFASSAKRIVLYPNPSSSQFRIDLPSAASYSLSIADLSGKEVLRQSVRKNEPISVAGLTKGLYLVTLQSTEGTYCQKLQVE